VRALAAGRQLSGHHLVQQRDIGLPPGALTVIVKRFSDTTSHLA
jgi:hypothetical protein